MRTHDFFDATESLTIVALNPLTRSSTRPSVRLPAPHVPFTAFHPGVSLTRHPRADKDEFRPSSARLRLMTPRSQVLVRYSPVASEHGPGGNDRRPPGSAQRQALLRRHANHGR